MISPYKIKWNELTSTEIPLDIITQCSFDGDSGESETFLGREAVVSETYNGAIKRGAMYKWNESFAPTITILKKDFSDFTRSENRQILSWLTSRQSPGFLDIYTDDSEVIEYSILGNFVSVSQYKLGNSRVVGYIAQFESLAPFAYSGLLTDPADVNMSNISTFRNVSMPSDNQFNITINTDDAETAVFPRITIKHNGVNYIRIADDVELDIHSDMIDNTAYFNGTTFYWKTLGLSKQTSIMAPNYNWPIEEVDHAYGDADTWEVGHIYKYGRNYYWLDPNTFHTDTKNPNLETTSVKITNTYMIGEQTYVATCKVANNTLDETIILDGANKVISSSRTSRIFGDDFTWEWLPLYDKGLAKDNNGVNTIKVEGNCSVAFEYREIRKVGSY